MIEIRFDSVTSPKVRRTKEGYYKGMSILSRTGVLHYKNADGSDRFELRHPDDVFNKDSMDSLKLIPITNDHPPMLVNAQNAHLVTQGTSGEDVKIIDGKYLACSLNISHKEAIKRLDSGIRQFSLGYALDLVPESGVYEGKPYTHRQTNIRYNHIAIVRQGRAGPMAAANLDSVSALSNQYHLLTEYRKDSIMNEELDQIAAVNKELQQNAVESSKDKEITALKSQIEQLKAQVEQKVAAASVNENKENKENKDSVDELAKARTDLILKAASVVNIDSLHSKSNREIMEAVIKARDRNFNADSRSDDYVQARFDSITENIQSFDAIRKQMLNIQPVFNADSKYKKSGDSILSVLKNQLK